MSETHYRIHNKSKFMRTVEAENGLTFYIPPRSIQKLHSAPKLPLQKDLQLLSSPSGEKRVKEELKEVPTLISDKSKDREREKKVIKEDKASEDANS